MLRAALTLACASLVLAGCGAGTNGRARPEPGAASSSGPRTAILTGTVLDAASGEPVPDAVVEAPGGISVRTDAHGRFRLAGLPEGATGEIVARGPQGKEARNPLRPLRPGTLEVVLHLR